MDTSTTAAAKRSIPVLSTATRRDAALVIGVSLVAAFFCVKLNVSEALLAWTRPRERFQLDELLPVLLVVAVSVTWFAGRRYRQACREIALRRRAEAHLNHALAENRRLAQLYLQMQEMERRALARDLHDELGQYLNAIKLEAVAIRDRMNETDSAAPETVLSMIQSIDRMNAVVVGLLRQLRPVGLDELGLCAAIEHCVGDWRRRLPHTVIELRTTGELDVIGEATSLALYRLVQEALTNVARHSSAKHVSIAISRENPKSLATERIRVRIIDDGVGAELDAPRSGLGLVGMRERLEGLGGSLTLTSEPGRGFELDAWLPLTP